MEMYRATSLGDDEMPYSESPRKVAIVRTVGACAWVLVGLLIFLAVISYWPVSGVTDAPHYARTIIYLSLSNHFPEVQAALGSISPPPPSFFL